VSESKLFYFLESVQYHSNKHGARFHNYQYGIQGTNFALLVF